MLKVRLIDLLIDVGLFGTANFHHKCTLFAV